MGKFEIRVLIRGVKVIGQYRTKLNIQENQQTYKLSNCIRILNTIYRNASKEKYLDIQHSTVCFDSN